MGSNQNVKADVRAGILCYICEQAVPVRVDRVGGHICAECHEAIEAMCLRYPWPRAYRFRVPYRPDVLSFHHEQDRRRK